MLLEQPKDGRYAKNAGAVFNLPYHIVWCPKYRRKVLVGDVEQRLKHILYAKAQQYGVLIETMEVMPDHVHLFVSSDPTRCVAEIVKRLKGASSRILRGEFPHLKSRLPTFIVVSFLLRWNSRPPSPVPEGAEAPAPCSRRVARRKKGSHRRRKAVVLLRKIHQHIFNQRNDQQHKLARMLVRQFGKIFVEDLNVKGLAGGMLAKAVHDASWSSFVAKLAYKAEEAGRLFAKVDARGHIATLPVRC